MLRDTGYGRRAGFGQSNGHLAGGGGLGGTCGKHSFGVGAGTTRGGSGAVVVKFLSPSPMTTVTVSGWQGYTQLDWPDYADTATTGYKVYWATTSAALNDSAISTLPAANIFTVTGATTSQYLHKNLAINSTFYYRVAATYTNAAGGTSTSPLSVLTSATTQLTDSKTFIQTGPNDSQQTTFAAKDLVVPANVSLIQFDANGASANSLGITGAWGTGGSVSAVVPVTAGETLKLYVGSQPMTVNGTIIAGWNGGGTSGYGISGYGGGASDVRRGGTALANRILVAGGAGGKGYNSYGGFGGGLIASNDSGAVIAGGTQTGPGAAPSNIAQTNGALGVGASTAQIYSGAGGGGYWGGNANVAQYGSGGGSSYTDPSANSVVHTKGGVTGDGSITATYSAQTLVPTGVKVVPGQAQNTIAWDRISLTGANGYKVYGGTTPNPTTLVATVTGVNTLAYVHTGLTNGSTYYYRVAATTNNTNLLTTGYSLEVAATPTFLATVNFETIRATQNWTVPQGVTWIQVTAKGASANALGITGSWGTGGTVSAILPVTPGEVLNINVGSQPNTINGVDTVGWNGGGTSGYGIAGYGGGASDIRRGGTALANRVLVAGGAGDGVVAGGAGEGDVTEFGAVGGVALLVDVDGGAVDLIGLPGDYPATVRETSNGRV